MSWLHLHSRVLRALAAGIACFLLTLAAVLLCVGAALAHEGQDHAATPSARGAALSSPRIVAASDRYQFVGIVENEVLVIYLDRATDNQPVTSAAIEVSLDGQPHKAEAQKNGTYEITAPALQQPGKLEVVIQIADADVSDLLVGGLTIGSTATSERPLRQYLLLGNAQWITAGLVLSVIIAMLVGIRTRRRSTPVLAAVVLVAMTSSGLAHDGHDHGPDLRASNGNNPHRRADGAIFLPKPSQRLLEVRTAILKEQSVTRTLRLAGRIAANPNFSGVVQSTISGRYEAPAGGVPPLGARVRAGDLLGKVVPAFASIDASDMAQTLGDIEQKLSIATAKLTRQELLLRSNVVAAALVEETRMEVAGLMKRRGDLLAARMRTDDLRSPINGVIAVSRAVSGQVVSPTDRLFEIVDPARVLAEALVFDQLDPGAATEASAVLHDGQELQLRMLGRSQALQQQYALMQFEVLDGAIAPAVGMPVTIIVRTGAPFVGLPVPRSALVQAPNGETVAFEHKEPELFVPRAVRTEPLDSQTVLITSGLAAGAKIVVKNALLVNQVQ